MLCNPAAARCHSCELTVSYDSYALVLFPLISTVDGAMPGSLGAFLSKK